MMKKRKLYRTQALKHYAQNRQKDILPQFISPPIFLLLWILLGVVVATIIFAWQDRIPTTTQVSGVILTDQSKSTATVLLFVPSSSAVSIRAGQQIVLQVNVTKQQFPTKIASIASGTITPEAARAQHHLTGDAFFAITRPSTVVYANLTPQQAVQVTDGLNVNAQIQVGSHSLLSSLPDLLKGAFGG